MAGYNWFMAILSLGMFCASFSVMYKTPLFSDHCALLLTHRVYKITQTVFYLTKFIEYLDTFWLYVMNKPITWLQWFHHIGAAGLMFCAEKYHSDSSWIFVNFNSFIHTFMYSYYALSLQRAESTKKSFLDTVKPLVTSSQIVQFLTGFYFLYQYRKVQCYVTDPYVMIGVYYHTWAYVGGVLLLFLNFYVRTYCKCGKKPRKDKEEKAGKQNGTSHGIETTTATTNGTETHTDHNKKKDE